MARIPAALSPAQTWSRARFPILILRRTILPWLFSVAHVVDSTDFLPVFHALVVQRIEPFEFESLLLNMEDLKNDYVSRSMGVRGVSNEISAVNRALKAEVSEPFLLR